MNFAVDNIFEILVSTTIVQWSVQWFMLFTPRVNDVVSTKEVHTNASSTFQRMICNDLIQFFSVNETSL